MNPSFGTGSALIGGQAVQQALARRQQGGATPALNQVSQAAPSAQPNMTGAPATASAIPQGTATPQQPQVTPGLPQGSPEAKVIIQALSNRLGTISKLETGGV